MKYSELRTLVKAIDSARKDKNNLKAYTLDKFLVDETTKKAVKTQFVLVSENECDSINADEEIARIRFQILDENTKRNSTVYVKMRDKVYIECKRSFLINYKLNDFETRKTFKESQALDDIVTDYEHLAQTITSLLAVHDINLKLEKKATEKKIKKATEKKATKKAVNK